MWDTHNATFTNTICSHKRGGGGEQVTLELQSAAEEGGREAARQRDRAKALTSEVGSAFAHPHNCRTTDG